MKSLHHLRDKHCIAEATLILLLVVMLLSACKTANSSADSLTPKSHEKLEKMSTKESTGSGTESAPSTSGKPLQSPELQRYKEWVLDLLSSPEKRLTEMEARTKFSASAVPDGAMPMVTSQINSIIKQIAPVTLVTAIPQGANALSLVLQPRKGSPDGEGKLALNLALDQSDPTKLGALFFAPYSENSPSKPEIPDYKSWQTFANDINKLATNASIFVSTLSPQTESCKAIFAQKEEWRYPLGSAFKLYVLYTLAELQESDPKLGWNQKLTVNQSDKSLPTGTTQNLPAGTQLSIKELAEKMISISDNTAADILIKAIGRDALEKGLLALGNDDPRNRPFLTTREMFTLRAKPEKFRRTYAEGTEAKRIELLKEIDASPLPQLSDLADWISEKKPRDIDLIEWYANDIDLCKLYANFIKRAEKSSNFKTALNILTINDGGMFPPPPFWDAIYFKGGSEPGVFNVSYLLKKGDKYYTFFVTLNDEKKDISPEVLPTLLGGLNFLRDSVTH